VPAARLENTILTIPGESLTMIPIVTPKGVAIENIEMRPKIVLNGKLFRYIATLIDIEAANL
jgi:hypothetical protein